MGIRQTMTMRATVTRWSSVAGKHQAHLASQPCRVEYGTGQQVIGEGLFATVKVLQMVAPIGADIVQGDKVTSVKNRMGVELFAGSTVSIVREIYGGANAHLAIELSEAD